MDGGTSVLDLFSLAIKAEKAAEALYNGLARLFAHNADVARFWKTYAEDEHGHADWLVRMRENLSAEQLAAPASSEMLMYAHKALRVPVEDSLAYVHDLQDAFDLVNDVESSETNAVFTFILEHYPINDEVLLFLQRQLEKHVSRLMNNFPAQYSSASTRSQVRAQHDAQVEA